MDGARGCDVTATHQGWSSISNRCIRGTHGAILNEQAPDRAGKHRDGIEWRFDQVGRTSKRTILKQLYVDEEAAPLIYSDVGVVSRDNVVAGMSCSTGVLRFDAPSTVTSRFFTNNTGL
jgi:hypothetical protein